MNPWSTRTTLAQIQREAPAAVNAEYADARQSLRITGEDSRLGYLATDNSESPAKPSPDSRHPISAKPLHFQRSSGNHRHGAGNMAAA